VNPSVAAFRGTAAAPSAFYVLLTEEDRMPDNKSNRGPADRSRISLKEDYEKAYWKKKFRVSGQALAGAVRAVGRSSKKVEAYLKER
jgi:hypothetical protein